MPGEFFLYINVFFSGQRYIFSYDKLVLAEDFLK